MDTKKFAVAVGAILIVFLIPVMVLPLRFTFQGVCGYIAIVLIAIATAAVLCIPDENFL